MNRSHETPSRTAVRRRELLATAAGLAGLGAFTPLSSAIAQPAWPSRSVKLIVPFIPSSRRSLPSRGA